MFDSGPPPFMSASLPARSMILKLPLSAMPPGGVIGPPLTTSIGPTANSETHYGRWPLTETSCREGAAEPNVEHADSERVRIIGEPVWRGLSSAAVTEWTRYESLIIELALAPLSLVRPYDVRELPDLVVAHAGRTHPELSN
jgi:hypothetical protein